ncbi:MAG: response regulator [Methyloprofundus sp.]|nr:response regulator [Methyloprofundus sp.]
MNIKIKSHLTRPTTLLVISSILAAIMLLYDWKNQNWLESILLLLILAIFLFYKKSSSTHEAHLHALLDNISDAIITIDAQGSVLTVNNAVEHMFGYRPPELLGKNIKMLMPTPHSEMHDSFLANFAKTGQKHIIGQTREVAALRRNGEVFDVELWVHQLNYNDETQFMGIIRDISERKHVDKIKTEFISTVSHELRTPLTSIKGSLGLLKSGVLGKVPEKANRMIELAHNNTERLINLVNDILDVEKIQAGKIELKLENVNLTDLVKQCIASNESYAASCQVSLHLADNLPDFQVFADNQRLQQVMANLISNAAKFSPENGRVAIDIKKHGQQIRVSVSDHGVGIPEEYRNKIFQKFSQVDSTDTRQKGGTGLGLNITKAIIEHHGGHIDYTTEEGKGSTFFFELLEYHEKTQTTPLEPSKNTAAIVSSIAKKVKDQGHILVLEDEKDIANLLSLLLEQQNFKVTSCHNAEDAKTLLANNHFDAVTVDIRLPGQDGLSFIKEVRAQEKDGCLPIIIISAEAELNKANTPSALRIIDWIDKPIDTGRLNKALQQALKKAADHQATILHIEDNKDLIEMMASLLNNKATLIHAATLQAAREKIASEKFDLVILDIGLPDGNGLDLIPLINKQKPLIPVIIFSAQSVDEDIINQVDAALVKSKVTNEELIDIIKNIIATPGANHDNS